MSWKDEFIAKYGEATYEKRLERYSQWKKANPGKATEHDRTQCRKGGKNYAKSLKYRTTELQGKRNRIRAKHRSNWREYKNIIAPNSQLHHQWHPGTSEYDGVALVEKDPHQHGIVDVIEILEGKISIFTEKELQGGLAI